MSLLDPPRCPLVAYLREQAEWANDDEGDSAIRNRETLTLCADRLENLNALVRVVFAGWPDDMIEIWPDEIQALGVEAGLLEPVEMTESCRSDDQNCSCEDSHDFATGPVSCYRRRGPIA